MWKKSRAVPFALTKRKLITHFKEAFSVKKNSFSFRNEFIPFVRDFCGEFFVNNSNGIKYFGNADPDGITVSVANCQPGRTFAKSGGTNAEPGRAVTFTVSIAVSGKVI